MVVFVRGDEIAIGSQFPRTADFIFEDHGFAVRKSWEELHKSGWRVKKTVLPGVE